MSNGTVSLRLVADRIYAAIPYDNGKGPLDAKRVDGARWAKSAMSWTYPADINVCRQLRRVFGDRLEIAPDLAQWAWEERKREESQIKLRSESDAVLHRVPEVAPVLAAAMSNRTYQRVGARYIADGKNVIIADEPGLGKTLETLAALVEVDAKRVLVFAKKKAIGNVWTREIERWLGAGAKAYPVTGTAAQREAAIEEFISEAGTGEYDECEMRLQDNEPMRIMICNIEMVRWPKDGEPKFPRMFEPFWDAVVVDESHKALIGKNTMSNSITQTRYGMMKLAVKPDGIRVALSGTPFRGKLPNLWGTLNWLQPRRFSSYWKFARDYFEVTDTGYALKIGEMLEGRKQAFDDMLAPIMLRRTKTEVAPEMPAKQYGGTPLDPSDPNSTIGVWLEMDPKQAKSYARIQADGQANLAGQMLTVNGMLAEMGRLRQFATCSWEITGYDKEDKPILIPVKPSAKFDWLVEFIEERRENGTKVVVASQYTKIVNAFQRWLAEVDIPSYTITGETKPETVDKRVEAFNDSSDDVPVMLINTLAGGESINLDACADDLVFLDETHIPDDQEQAEDRIHRMSRMHQVSIWYLRSLDSIEEEICRITGARNGKIKDRLDGSRGIEIMRKIMEA